MPVWSQYLVFLFSAKETNLQAQLGAVFATLELHLPSSTSIISVRSLSPQNQTTKSVSRSRNQNFYNICYNLPQLNLWIYVKCSCMCSGARFAGTIHFSAILHNHSKNVGWVSDAEVMTKANSSTITYASQMCLKISLMVVVRMNSICTNIAC